MKTANSLTDVLKKLKEHFEKQPAVMIDSAEKVLVVGDVHGDLEAMNYVKKVKPKYDKVVFVGDFVDRGENDIEVVQSLPDFMSDVILVGNHDVDSNIGSSDFLGKLIMEFEQNAYDVKLAYHDAFANAPVAYYNPHHKLLVLHGGIPIPVEKYGNFNEWNKWAGQNRNIPHQIVWNDFCDIAQNWPSDRGRGISEVGINDTLKFMNQNNLELIVRGHDSSAFNSVLDLSEEKKVVTVGSSSHYAERRGRAVYDVAKKKLIEF